MPGIAFSQDDEEFMVEEIVVTARKIGESIQDIPLSITAFSAQDIQNRQIVDLDDIAQFTPGVHLSNRLGTRNSPPIRIRGMDPPSEERNKQLASAFVDGVYLPGTAQWVSMNDIERVEVVKGPQSAFFGRATFGGAINFITKTPGNEWGGDLQAIVGDSGRADLWLSAHGPIIEDVLAFRASGRTYTYDGAWTNTFPGSDNLGSQETLAGSLTLYFTPNDDVRIKFRTVYSVDDDGLGVMFLDKGFNNNCGPFDPTVPRASSYFCGTLTRERADNGLAIDTSPMVDTTYKRDAGLYRRTQMSTLSIDWDIGDYTVSSLTGMYEEDTQEMRELLTDELMVFLEWQDESFSQELRLTSPQDRPLRWMIGAYYLDLEYTKNGRAGFPCTSTASIWSIFFGGERGGGCFPVNPTTPFEVENTAIFGSLSYDINDQWTISAEIRRAEEDISNGTVRQEAPPLDPTDPVGTAQPFGGAEIALDTSFKSTTPRIILDYKPNEDTTYYVSYAEGNNPGGFNPEVIQMAPAAFDAFFAENNIGYDVQEAELEAWELGIKHSLASGRGYINGALYMYEWTNQRFRGFQAFIDSNGDGVYIPRSDRLGGQIDYDGNGSTDIFGFEIAANYAFNENWSGSFAYNYNKTDIKVYEDAVLFRVVGKLDASDREVPRSPKHSASAAVDFNTSTEAFGGGEWFARWDAWYQSETYTWVINLAQTEAALLHNVRGGWRNDRYSVTAWIENALDDDSVLNSTRTTGSFFFQTLGFNMNLPEPRTYGVTFTARFGGE